MIRTLRVTYTFTLPAGYQGIARVAMSEEEKVVKKDRKYSLYKSYGQVQIGIA